MNTRASIQDMIATVVRSLDLDILPQIGQADVAGKVRACIALLTYAEDRVEQDRDVLFADATEMRAMLAAAIKAGIRIPSAALLERIPSRIDNVSTKQLVEEDASYRAALSDLVEHLSREAGSPASPIRHLLRQTLARMQARAYATLQRVERVPPI